MQTITNYEMHQMQTEQANIIHLTASLWEAGLTARHRNLYIVALTSTTLFLARHQSVLVGSGHHSGVKPSLQRPAKLPWKSPTVLFRVQGTLCYVHQSLDARPSPF